MEYNIIKDKESKQNKVRRKMGQEVSPNCPIERPGDEKENTSSMYAFDT